MIIDRQSDMRSLWGRGPRPNSHPFSSAKGKGARAASFLAGEGALEISDKVADIFKTH